MPAQDIHKLLVAIPFKAFYIQTTRTGRYDITAPDSVLLTRTKLYLTRDHDADGIAGDVQIVPIAQITEINLL